MSLGRYLISRLQCKNERISRKKKESCDVLTIRLLSSEDEEDFLSRWGPGDFCKAFTLVSEPGSEAGGVADKPVVEPKCGEEENV